MAYYLLKRCLLIIPTLFLLLSVMFVLTQLLPSGPLDLLIARLNQQSEQHHNYFMEGGSALPLTAMQTTQQGGRAQLSESLSNKFETQKSLLTQYGLLLKRFLQFDFGQSYFMGKSVIDLILERFPISFLLSFLSIVFIYMISLPLGIKKAIAKGKAFDTFSTFLLAFFYAMPSFLLAILLIIFLAGGSFFDVFPLRGLMSEGWATMSLWAKTCDLFWHLFLPVTVIVLSGMASKTLFVRNMFLEEFHKKYILTARAKGVGPQRILYKHILRNALLPLIANFPSHFIRILYKNTLVIEIVFSIDGLGLLAYEATMNRDYPILFGLIFIMAFLSIVMHLIGDILYRLIDPRIGYQKESRGYD